MILVSQMPYEEIDGPGGYDFYLMKKTCTCEKTFKTIGIGKNAKAETVRKQFKQLIPAGHIPAKQMVTLYTGT